VDGRRLLIVLMMIGRILVVQRAYLLGALFVTMMYEGNKNA
jgi:hypothetical protein